MKLPLALALALTPALPLALACGGPQSRWTPQDAAQLQDIARDQLGALDLCAVDAGTCNAGQVRAVDRADYCAAVDVLMRHGAPTPEAGIPCRPRL